MSNVSAKGITEYQKIFKKTFGVEISVEEASEQANSLIDFLWLMLPKGRYGNEYEKPKSRSSH